MGRCDQTVVTAKAAATPPMDMTAHQLLLLEPSRRPYCQNKPTRTRTHIHMCAQVNLGDAGDREARVLLARYASGLASLERPRLSAEVAADAPRLQAYSRALQVAVQAARPGVCLCGRVRRGPLSRERAGGCLHYNAQSGWPTPWGTAAAFQIGNPRAPAAPPTHAPRRLPRACPWPERHAPGPACCTGGLRAGDGGGAVPAVPPRRGAAAGGKQAHGEGCPQAAGCGPCRWGCPGLHMPGAAAPAHPRACQGAPSL